MGFNAQRASWSMGYTDTDTYFIWDGINDFVRLYLSTFLCW